MDDPVYKARSSTRSHFFTEPARFLETEPDGAEREPEDTEDEPDYGHRWVTQPDGSLREVPLTYADLLDPQEGDFIAEDTVHGKVIRNIISILERRYRDESTVAVWSDFKVNVKIRGLTSGPGPDVCVAWGVEDRDRRRRSFDPRKEPGEVRFVMEVVSEKSVEKDHKDILKIYHRLGVEEYIAIRPEGLYPAGPFSLRGWRRNPKTNRLRLIQPDKRGRLSSRTTGLLFGTGEDGWGLKVWDAATGRLMRPSDEEAAVQTELVRHAEGRAEWAEERAERAEGRAEWAVGRAERADERAHRAEERAQEEAEARQETERLNRELMAEIKRLRGEP